MNNKVKSITTHLLKLALGLGIYIYFLGTNKIHFNFFADPRYLIGFFILFGGQILIFILSNYRWFLIIKKLKLHGITPGLRGCGDHLFTVFKLPVKIDPHLSDDLGFL